MNILIFTLVILGTIITSTMYASVFEWVLHKHVMHKKPFGFNYAYKHHHQIHHVVFGGYKTYKLSGHKPEKQEKDKKTIPMAWWNWIVLLIIAVSPIAATISIFFGVWFPAVVTAIIFFLYYCTYEYTHWCMHDSKGRWFENKKWFLNLDHRHRLHHQNTNTNFNVVWPFADFLLKTLRT